MREEKRKGYEQREAEKRMRADRERAEMSRKERKEADRKERKKTREKRARNKEFARVTYIFIALFLAMMGYISYFQVTRSREYIQSPYNARKDSLADRVVRGNILDRTGKVLAQTNVAEDGTETREYPYGNMFAHVVGYTAQGKTGLESYTNFDLLASNSFFLKKIKNEFQDKKNMGDNVVTTLDAKLQETLVRAKKEIEKRQGRKDRQIFIKAGHKNMALNLCDILYFENQRRKIAAHTLRGEISFYGVMADMERETGADFCRCHRGYLVNLFHVTEYDRETITLSNGERIYLSKDRYHDFVKQYMRYLRNGGVSHV